MHYVSECLQTRQCSMAASTAVHDRTCDCCVGVFAYTRVLILSHHCFIRLEVTNLTLLYIRGVYINR